MGGEERGRERGGEGGHRRRLSLACRASRMALARSPGDPDNAFKINGCCEHN